MNEPNKDKLTQIFLPIAGKPLTLLVIMGLMGGSAELSDLCDITGWSLPTTRKALNICKAMGYLKKRESYHKPVYFFDDGIKQLSFFNAQSERFLHIPYSSSIKLSNKDIDIKLLKTTTTKPQSEKNLQISDISQLTQDYLKSINIWPRAWVEIVEELGDNIAVIGSYFPKDTDIALSMWRFKQGSRPDIIKNYCPGCGKFTEYDYCIYGCEEDMIYGK